MRTNTTFNSLFFLLFFCPLTLFAQWSKTNGLPGGEIHQFAVLGDTILCSSGVRLHYSTDNGNTWNEYDNFPVTNYLYNLKVFDHAILACDFTTLHLSRDHGLSWISFQCPDSLDTENIFLSGNSVFLTSYRGIFRTDDYGIQWTKTSNYWLKNPLFDGTALTAVHYPYLVRSYNLGLTFDTLLQFTGNTVNLVQQNQEIYLFLYGENNGCWYSSDNGTVWQHFLGTSFDYSHPEAHFIHNSKVYGVRSGKLVRSDDHGDNWAPTNFSVKEYITGALSKDNVILIGSDNSGIWQSTDDGYSWHESNNGMNCGRAGTMNVIDNHLFAPGFKSVYQLNNDENNWTSLNLPVNPYGYYHIQYIKSGNNLVSLRAGSGYVSVDSGATWSESYISPAWPGLYYQMLEFVQTSNRIFAIAYVQDSRTVLISDDHGLTFIPVTVEDTVLFKLGALTGHLGKLYAMNLSGKISQSDDEGHTWTALPATPPTGIFGTSSNLILKTGGNVFLIYDDNDKFKPSFTYLISPDLGQTWTIRNTSWAEWGFSVIYEMTAVGNLLIAATNSGVFISQDNGLNWISWNEGLKNLNVLNIEVFDNYLWAAAGSHGIWKRPLSQLDFQPIDGIVYYDNNANNLQDIDEPGAPSIIIQSLVTGAFTTTTSNGSFSTLSNLSNETLKVYPPGPAWSVTPSEIDISVPASNLAFGLQANAETYDLAVYLTNVSTPRPGFYTYYDLNWKNNGTKIIPEATLTLSFPENDLDLFQVLPAPNAQNGNTLTWNLENISPNASEAILILFKVPTSVPLGRTICLDAAVNFPETDISPADNTEQSCAIVAGSLDPNDKQATPADVLTPAEIAAGKAVDFTIRFQNTGTYPATTVRIVDTIQSGFDPSTFHFFASSHPCRWTMRGQGIVEFTFENIQLPDHETNEPGSHGFVRYSVRPNALLPLGTILRNTAYIYFDFNEPIVTNTTQNTVSLPVNVEQPGNELSMLLSPNPASESVSVWHLGMQGILRVYDPQGRILLIQETQESGITQLPTEKWGPGIYEVVLEDGQHRRMVRLVIAQK